MAKQMPKGTYYGDIPVGGYQNVTWTDWLGNPVEAGWIEPEVEGEDYHGFKPVDEFGVVIPDSKPLPFKAMPRIEWNWLPETAGFGQGGPARPIQDPDPDHIGQIVNPYTVGRTLRYYDWSDPDSLKVNPFLTDYFKSQFHPDIAKFLPAYSEHNLMSEHTDANPGDAELITSMLEGYNPWTTDAVSAPDALGWPDPSQAWTNLAPREADPLKVDPIQAPQDMGQQAAEVNWGMIMRLPPRLRAYMMEQYVDADEERHGHLESLGLDPKDAPGWGHEGRPGVMGGWNPGVKEGDPLGGGPPGGTPGGPPVIPPGGGGGGPPGGTPGGGGGTPWYDPNFDALPGYPNINYPGRNPVRDPVTDQVILRGHAPFQYAHTSRQPDPMWGGGPQTWLSGWPVSNAWLGGMQPLMANDPWALTESGIQAGMLPPTMGNFFGGYWDANFPLTPQRNPIRFGDPGSPSSPWGQGWKAFDVGGGDYYVPRRPTEEVQWGDVPYTGYNVPGTQLPTPDWVGTYPASEPGDTFMNRAGVTQEQYNLARDPGAWRGGQTFGQRTGMSQEAFNTARNAAAQRQTAAAQQSGYGQPVRGPGQFGGAYGTFDPTTEFGQQGGEPRDAFARQMGVTQQQYNLAQNPGAWRGDQSFGERVGMSQEAYNIARNRAKFGQPVQGAGEFGGAFGTFGPDDVGGGMVHPSQRALPSPTQTASEPGVSAQPTGMGQITPGVLGGMGTAAQFNLAQNPDAWRGTQFGSTSSITPGTLGGGQTPFFGAPSPITPGTMGGGGMQQQEAPQGQWNYQGMFSPQRNQITPGTLGGRGTMPRRTSISPGRLGGGNMYGSQQRGY